MIPRTMRLSRAHFAPSGPEKRAASPHFSVSVRTVSEHGGCAVVVSKKVAKRSVIRHLVKRRVFSVIRPFCSPTLAIIVYARPGAQDISFETLSKELNDVLVSMR